MIFFLSTAQHRYTVRPLLKSWTPALAAEVVLLPYEALPSNHDLPPGTYIFSDVERLTEAQRTLAARVYDQLAAAGSAVRILNHPARSLRRYDLLHALHERGLNHFRAFRPFRAAEPGQPWRYPLFLRGENDHDGNQSPLIRNAKELRKALPMALMQGLDPRNLLIVEFCDTQDSGGLYRKYSAFRVGERIIPRHVLFSRNWVLKDVDLLEPAQFEEMKRYCATNPHEQGIRSIFDLARIEYGRIDYAVLNGKIQTWEINTNPVVIKELDDYPPERRAFHEEFAATISNAFLELNSDSRSGPRIPIIWGDLDVFGN